MLPVQIGKQTYSKFFTENGTANDTVAAVSDNPTELAVGVYVRNNDSSNSMYVGTEDLTAANGFLLTAGESLLVPAEDAREVYVLRATADLTYSILAM